MRVIEVNFNGINGEKSFFSKMNKELSLPNYFNFNFESLDECMRDLSWFPEDEILINIKNLRRIEKKNRKLYIAIHESFDLYKEYWDNYKKKKVIFVFI